jgi:pilus assembly protein Flp/PilA
VVHTALSVLGLGRGQGEHSAVGHFARAHRGTGQKSAMLISPGPEGHVMLSHLSRFVVDFLQREDGPTAVEYAVMLALIIVVCIAAITTLGNNAKTTFTTVGSTIGASS